jgi:hypothetical protein
MGFSVHALAVQAGRDFDRQCALVAARLGRTTLEVSQMFWRVGQGCFLPWKLSSGVVAGWHWHSVRTSTQLTSRLGHPALMQQQVALRS